MWHVGSRAIKNCYRKFTISFTVKQKQILMFVIQCLYIFECITNSMFVYLQGCACGLQSLKSLKKIHNFTHNSTKQTSKQKFAKERRNINKQAFIMFNISTGAAIHNWPVNQKPGHFHRFQFFCLSERKLVKKYSKNISRTLLRKC